MPQVYKQVDIATQSVDIFSRGEYFSSESTETMHNKSTRVEAKKMFHLDFTCNICFTLVSAIMYDT